jgi:hypothetical protein
MLADDCDLQTTTTSRFAVRGVVVHMYAEIWLLFGAPPPVDRSSRWFRTIFWDFWEEGSSVELFTRAVY